MRRLRLVALLPALLGLAAGCASSGAPIDRPPGFEEEQRGDQIMVLLEPAPEQLWKRTLSELARDFELTTVAAWTMQSIDAPCVIVEPRDRTDSRELVARLERDHRVELAQPVQTFETLAEAAGYNDPYHHLQHGVRSIRAAAAHQWATGRSVRVAVVDTGVEIGHPELAGRVVLARNFVDRGGESFTSDVHGTTVAGVIAAVGNNSTGIVGVAPEADLLALKACWPTRTSPGAARCSSYTLALAIDFALVQGIDVLNLSLGGPEDPILRRLLTVAMREGVAVVAARAPGEGSFPASLDGVIAVATSDEAPAEPGVLSAPGTDILTTVPFGSYDFVSGSSVAAAHVSGVVALLLEARPHIVPDEIRRILVESSTEAERRTEDIDACRAVAHLSGDECAAAPPTLAATTPSLPD